MIDKIYELVADKTLSFGCIIKTTFNKETNPFIYLQQ